jgi:hypothetical protein
MEGCSGMTNNEKLQAIVEEAAAIIIRKSKEPSDMLAAASLLLATLCDTLELDPKAAHVALDLWNLGDVEGWTMQ